VRGGFAPAQRYGVFGEAQSYWNQFTLYA